MQSGMTLRHWEIVRAVISTGSVTRAAKILAISQPSVSQALRHAEDQLGFELFNRVNGRLHATFETSLLTPEIERVFERIAVVGDLARELRESRQGHVNIATIPTLAAALIPPAVARFRIALPAVPIRFQVLPTREVMRLVRHHLVDLVVIHTYAIERDFEAEEIARAEMVAVLPNTHPLASGAEITPKQLRGHPVIAGREALDKAIKAAFNADGEEPEISIEINHTLTACALAAVGHGIALVDPFVRPYLGSDVRVLPFRPAIPLSVRIVSSSERPLSRFALRFIADLKAAAGGPGEPSPSPVHEGRK